MFAVNATRFAWDLGWGMESGRAYQLTRATEPEGKPLLHETWVDPPTVVPPRVPCDYEGILIHRELDSEQIVVLREAQRVG